MANSRGNWLSVMPAGITGIPPCEGLYGPGAKKDKSLEIPEEWQRGT